MVTFCVMGHLFHLLRTFMSLKLGTLHVVEARSVLSVYSNKVIVYSSTMSLALPSVFCPIYFPSEASGYCLSDTYNGVKHLSEVFLFWPVPVARVPKMQCFSQICFGKRSAEEEQIILGSRENLFWVLRRINSISVI